jgi:hypothetical protein
VISSRQATDSYSFVRTTQYIYEEDNHYALVRLGRQGAFKSTTVYYVRAGKGLNTMLDGPCSAAGIRNPVGTAHSLVTVLISP